MSNRRNTEIKWKGKRSLRKRKKCENFINEFVSGCLDVTVGSAVSLQRKWCALFHQKLRKIKSKRSDKRIKKRKSFFFCFFAIITNWTLRHRKMNDEKKRNETFKAITKRSRFSVYRENGVDVNFLISCE